jgi:hypothetical protein
MTGVRIARAVTSALLAGLCWVGWPTAAHASCAQGAGPEGSPVIFVGRAIEERRGYSKFQVTEVWAGPDLATNVWVLSGQEQPAWPFYYFQGVASSVDADFKIGKEYVVGAGRGFATSSCSIAASGDNQLKPPADVRAPTDDGSEGADPPPGPMMTGAGLGLLLAAPVLVVTGLVGRRRRSSE